MSTGGYVGQNPVRRTCTYISHGKPDASFWLSLYSPKYLERVKFCIVSAERDVESDDGVASLDHLEVLWVESSLLGSRREEQFDLLEETRLPVLIHLWAELRLSGEGTLCCWSDYRK